MVNQAIDGVSCDHEARWNSAKKRFTFRCCVIFPVHSFANEYLPKPTTPNDLSKALQIGVSDARTRFEHATFPQCHPARKHFSKVRSFEILGARFPMTRLKDLMKGYRNLQAFFLCTVLTCERVIAGCKIPITYFSQH